MNLMNTFVNSLSQSDSPTSISPQKSLDHPNFDVIVFEFVFDRPHEHDKSPLLKVYGLKSDFQKPPYLWLKTPFTCGREVQTEKKISVVEHIRIRMGQGLRLHPNSINRDSGIEIPEA